jgi:hypothetical protein
MPASGLDRHARLLDAKQNSYLSGFWRHTWPRHLIRCCQMVYFLTKNPNLGKVWMVLQSILQSILRPNGIFYGHLVHFVIIWYIIPILVCCTDKNLATLNFDRENKAFPL